MSLFPIHYRQHVMPKLRQQIDLQAFLIACDTTTYSDAHAEVIGLAHRYGAGYLPDRLRDQLHDWISDNLLSAIMAAEPRVEAVEADIERRAATDPVTHYTELAAQCRPGMEWVFAAISPEYRAHLQAVRRAGP